MLARIRVGLCLAALMVFAVVVFFNQSSRVLAQANPTQLELTSLTQTPTQSSPLEFEIITDATANNPFDPAQIDLQVRFTSSTGKVSLVPAFWFQDYDQSVQPMGKPGWRVRFTPLEAGTLTVLALISNPKLEGQAIMIAVQASSKTAGFVRINQKNPRYFQLDNGKFFLPTGLNIAWASQPNSATVEQYRRWFDGLAKNGGNVARVWMASWSLALEWNDTGLGNYSNRLSRAWLLDQIFKLAQERGIYIELCFLNHGAFSKTVNPEWDANPYNLKNGGMLSEPGDFVTNAAAKEMFKRRVRYIAARWGYSSQVFAWEWWNEVNWTPIGDEVLIPWIKEMTAYIRTLDPNRHLVSSSYASGGTTKLWRQPEIDFAQEHDYSNRDPATFFASGFGQVAENAPKKPVILAELGYSSGGADDSPVNRDAIHFHNGIWAAPFSGYASTGMYWWWDNFVDPQNRWFEYKALHDFMGNEDLTSLKPARASTSDVLGTSALSLFSKARTLVWVRSNDYEAGSAYKAYRDALLANKAKNWIFKAPIKKGITLTLKNLEPGVSYKVAVFSVSQDRYIGKEIDVVAKQGEIKVKLPDFSQDLAVKIWNPKSPINQPK